MELIKSASRYSNLQYKIFENADHSLYAGGRKPVHIKYMQEWLKNKITGN